METYHDKKNADNTLKLREMLKTLPQFVAGYFRSMSDQTAPLTRIAYAYDLGIFFNFLAVDVLVGTAQDSINTEQMATITSDHLEEFMEYLTYYIPARDPDTALQNAAKGKSRKLAAVRGLFKYLYKKKLIPANPAELIGFPKITEKVITTLEPNEIARLIDEAESGENLTDRQQIFHERTKLRDVAIITLLLGTGIRVSECVGLDIRDIDFEANGFRVTRKGGDEMVLYFGREVEEALGNYLDQREELDAIEGHEQALFLSLQNRRITTRQVQKMVKKYAAIITPLKKISPHKLRSTFGTQLYTETGDIYLVANVLGHADVNTTRKHYAKMDDSYRRRAANAVKLRE
ncbi:MAG: tyrosine-type recombinase/integrase [Defluviitaleaceae bacterium]|nr:tyrosine-type recombinase/integrase [Defluviitaleaceae bacterium]